MCYLLTEEKKQLNFLISDLLLLLPVQSEFYKRLHKLSLMVKNSVIHPAQVKESYLISVYNQLVLLFAEIQTVISSPEFKIKKETDDKIDFEYGLKFEPIRFESLSDLFKTDFVHNLYWEFGSRTREARAKEGFLRWLHESDIFTEGFEDALEKNFPQLAGHLHYLDLSKAAVLSFTLKKLFAIFHLEGKSYDLLFAINDLSCLKDVVSIEGQHALAQDLLQASRPPVDAVMLQKTAARVVDVIAPVVKHAREVKHAFTVVTMHGANTIGAFQEMLVAVEQLFKYAGHWLTDEMSKKLRNIREDLEGAIRKYGRVEQSLVSSFSSLRGQKISLFSAHQDVCKVQAFESKARFLKRDIGHYCSVGDDAKKTEPLWILTAEFEKDFTGTVKLLERLAEHVAKVSLDPFPLTPDSDSSSLSVEYGSS